MNDLLDEVREELDTVTPESMEDQRDVLLEEVARDKARKNPGRRRVLAACVAAAALLLAVVGVAALVSSGEVDEAPPTTRSETQIRWINASEDAQRISIQTNELRFESGSRGRVKEDSAKVLTFLERGRVVASVDGSSGVAWDFLAGPYTVHVVGTELAVAWGADSGRLEVMVYEGEVKVVGGNLGEGLSVSGGQVLVARMSAAEITLKPIATAPTLTPPTVVLAEREAREEVKDEGDADADAETPAAPDVTPTATPRRRRASAPHAEGLNKPPKSLKQPKPPKSQPQEGWKRKAEAGHHREALEAARAAGLAQLQATLPAGDMLLLADCARLGGAQEDARQTLRALRQRFPGSAPARAAAFRLGRLSSGAPEQTRWFRTYLREAPRGPLAADASGRLVQSLHRSGDPAARDAARDYLSRHPTGAHAAYARRVLDAGTP